MDKELKLELTVDLKSGKATINNLGKQLDSVNEKIKTVDKTTKKTSKGMLSSFEKLTIVLNQSAELLSKFIRLMSSAKKPFEEAGAFESFRVTIENLTGDIDLAHERFKEMVQFAAVTPFNVPGIVEAGNRLEALGRYSLDTIRMLGDLAAAAGKDVMQAVEAYTNLVTGRTGIAVKQFRALLIANSDWTNTLGKQVLQNARGAKASVEEMLEALPEIIAKKGFTGLMKKQSQTFLGLVSNLEDAWQRFMAGLGDKGLKEVKQLVRDLIVNLEYLNARTEKLVKIFKVLAEVLGVVIGGMLLKKLTMGIAGLYQKAVPAIAKVGSLARSLFIGKKAMEAFVTSTKVAGTAIKGISMGLGGWITALISAIQVGWLLYDAIKATSIATSNYTKDLITQEETLITNNKAKLEKLEAEKKLNEEGQKLVKQLINEKKMLAKVTEGSKEWQYYNNKVLETQTKLTKLYPKLSSGIAEYVKNGEDLKKLSEDIGNYSKSVSENINKTLADIEKAKRKILNLKIKDTIEEMFGSGLIKNEMIKKTLKVQVDDLMNSFENPQINMETARKNIDIIVDNFTKAVLKAKGEEFDPRMKAANQGFYAVINSFEENFKKLLLETRAKSLEELRKDFEENLKKMLNTSELTTEQKKTVAEKIYEMFDNLGNNVDLSSLKGKMQETFSKFNLPNMISDILTTVGSTGIKGYLKKTRDAIDQLSNRIADEAKRKADEAKKKIKGFEEEFKTLTAERDASKEEVVLKKEANSKQKLAQIEEDYYKKVRALQIKFIKSYLNDESWKTSRVQKLNRDMLKGLNDAYKEKYSSLYGTIMDMADKFELEQTPLEKQLAFYKEKFGYVSKDLQKEAQEMLGKNIEQLTEDDLTRLNPVIVDFFIRLRSTVYALSKEQLARKDEDTLLAGLIGINNKEGILEDVSSVITTIGDAFKINIDTGGIVTDTALAKVESEAQRKQNELRQNAPLGQVNERESLEIERQRLEAIKKILEAKLALLQVPTEEETLAKESGDEATFIKLQNKRKQEAENTKASLKQINQDITSNTLDTKEAVISYWEEVGQKASEFIYAIGGALTSMYENELNQIKKNNEAWLKAYNTRLEAQKKFTLNFAHTEAQRVAIEEEFRKREEAAKEEARKKEEAVKKKIWEHEKAVRMINIIMDTAASVAKVLANPILAGIVAATGAVQLATVAAQQYPGYATGGYTGEGDERDIGGIVHKREFVINAKATKKYRPLLEAINKDSLNLINNQKFNMQGINIENAKLVTMLESYLKNPVAPNIVITKTDARRIVSNGVMASRTGG